MSISELIKTNFIDPIIYGTGYNPINTTTYALLFLFLVDATFKTIKKFKINMSRFFNAFLPYIFLGGVIRTLTDAGVYPHTFAFVTPGIYLLMLALTFIDTFFNLPLGWILLAINLTGVVVKNNAPNLVFAFGFMATALSVILLRFLRFKIGLVEIGAILAHMIDAASTFVAIDLFRYGEQHVLANFFISTFSTAAVMFPLKLLALAIIIKAFESLDDPDMRNFLYLVVIAIGIGPGIRNTLSVAMGV